MKKVMIGMLLLGLALTVKAQHPSPKTPGDPDIIPEPVRDTVPVHGVYKFVEQEPEFPGGSVAFNRFLAKNLRYPNTAGSFEGKIFIQFIVEKNGSLSHIHAIKPHLPEFNAEAIRVMKLSPKWKPGMQHGRIVRVAYTIPVTFALHQ
jgi:TonB-like protein